MHPRESTDPPFHGLNVSLDVIASREPNDRLRKRQRILRAVIDFPSQQILTVFRPAPFRDIKGDTADAHQTAAPVKGCSGRANAPASLAVRPIDSKLCLI